MRCPCLPLLLFALVATNDPLSAQARARSWELGPALRIGHGAQVGPELRRVLPISRRVDARLGGTFVWTTSRPMGGAVYGWSGENDNRRPLYVVATGADLRFRLVDARYVGVSLVNGIGLAVSRWGAGTHTQWEWSSDASTVVYDVYDPRASTTVAATVSAGLGLRLGRSVHVDLGADVYSDRTADLLGALRASARIGW